MAKVVDSVEDKETEWDADAEMALETTAVVAEAEVWDAEESKMMERVVGTETSCAPLSFC
jgi:hypothetical protein